MKRKQIFGAIAAVLFIVAGQVLPGTETLEKTGVATIGCLLACLIMLVMEVLPVIVTCLIFPALMPHLGVTKSFGMALIGYGNPVVFFTLVSFGLAAAFTITPLSKRILKALIKAFGKNVRMMLLAIMLCAALVSTIVSNVPTCAVFIAIGIGFLDMYNNEADRRKSGRAFTIGIAIASMVGGMATPAGSSINLLALTLLEENTGQTVTFVQWMCAGVPLTFLILPVAWWLVIKVYKPVEINRDYIARFVEMLEVPREMTLKEKKALIVTAGMFVLWVLSSWIPSINVMIVAVIGCAVMMLPGVEIFDVKTFLRENSWDSFFLVGTIMSIANAMVQNGVSSWMISMLPSLHMPIVPFIAFTVVFMFVMLLIIPVASSITALMVPTLIAICATVGVSPALVVLAAALCSCNCYLLPLDTVTLIAYSKGYFSMTDMARSTFFLQLWVVIVISLWLPVVGEIFGMI